MRPQGRSAPLDAGTDNDDGYVVKLSPTGNHVWSRRIGARDADVFDCLVDDDGNVDWYAEFAATNTPQPIFWENSDEAWPYTMDNRLWDNLAGDVSWTLNEIDGNHDGTIDERFTVTYDAQGNMTARTADNDADGTLEASERRDLTYDAANNIIVEATITMHVDRIIVTSLFPFCIK